MFGEMVETWTSEKKRALGSYRLYMAFQEMMKNTDFTYVSYDFMKDNLRYHYF